MRCRRHPYEGGVGVCAPCLRDRLLALAAAQNEASSLPPTPLPEPVPVFPRSVSPYVCRRKSDASGARKRAPSLLFFRTPQVGPAYGGGGGAGFVEGDIEFEIRRRSSKFSVLAALFGGHRHHGSEEKGGGKERKQRSWLAAIMSPWGLRKKDPAAASQPSPPRRSCHVVSNRGLSPVMGYADEGGEEGSSTAESPWRPSPSPMRKTPCRRRPGAAAAGVSGFAVCISPLVRPSPGRQHRGGHPPDATAFSGELGPSPLHRLSSSTSLQHCRSWKLADGGRFR
ncbi:uncharacterized protein LOC102699401 [Oryza brachyantha]|uniref:uncharacterized protein LOC102699401 n=1 Tax=Oryza brachyantha TaxID=4533 RepID=UPI001AD98CDF|nr:uncharacterized protein LOC102699401 [Oryza brachyantha]